MKALKLLAVNSCAFLKPREKDLVFQCLDHWEQLQLLVKSELEYLIGRKLPRVDWKSYQALLGSGEIERVRLALDREKIHVFQLGDSDYPSLLKEIYDPPFVLFAKGESWNNISGIGVVGTRYPSSEGEKAARELGRELAKCGIPSISGLARGIDSAAHWGTVQLGGKTVAVLGHGHNFVYPKGHAYLAAKICNEGGSLISEFNPNISPKKFQFPQRNRIISGLSIGTVVVEAPEKSGALITADFALEQNREVWIHKNGLGTKGKGGEKLVQQGAVIISEVSDILRDLGLFQKVGK